MAEKSKKKRALGIAIVVAIAWGLLASVLVSIFPHVGEGLNGKVYDWKMSLAPLPEPHSKIVHVDVDDEAIRQYGLWPWDRSISAKMVKRLCELGAKVIVFDILYTAKGASQEGDEAFLDAVKQAGNAVMPAAMGISSNPHDKLEVDADRSRGDALYDVSWPMVIPNEFRPLHATSLRNSMLPMTPLILDSKAVGHICATPDRDGVYRRIPLLVRLEDRYVPSLSLAILKSFLGLPSDSIALTRKGELRIEADANVIRIPVDSRSMMLVNWGNVWESFKSYSVTDLLSDKADQARASRYKDKIVIVGVVGTGSTDFGVTPRDIRSPLSRIHSHALSTMLTDVFIRQLQAFPWLVVLAIVLIALYAVGMARLSIKAALVVLVSACVVIVAIGVVSFAYLSYDVPVAEILIIFAPAAVASLAVRVATIELQALRTSRAVERYLSPELLSSIVDGEADLDISSKRVELTIVFVDIQGFSTISETVAVEYISQLLNDFLDTMTRAVFEYRGTVDKFLGDGLLAFFGDPVPLDNHAQAAVNAAVKMQRDMSELNARWTVSGIAELAGGIQIRIGINTGLVVVGNIGSTQRLEYTVVGSAVNIASRLQSLAPPGGIIMTSRTKALLKDAIQCEGPDYVRVKGIDKDIEVHRLQPEQIQKK